MNNEDVQEYVCLEIEKHRLDGDVKRVKQKLQEKAALLIPQFVEAHCTKTTVDGRTVSLVMEVHPAMVEGREGVVAALREEGLDQYIGVNHQAFGGYVREVFRDVEDAIARENAGKPPEMQRIITEDDVRAALPPALREQVMITFTYKLRSQKA